MTDNVQNYIDAARAAQGSATLGLTGGQDNSVRLTARSGWFAKWSASFRKTENRALALRFVGALAERYGMQVATSAVTEAGFRRTMDRGKPLHCRQVLDVTRRADELQQAFREGNRHLAERVWDNHITESHIDQGVPRAQAVIAAKVRTRFRESPSVNRLLDTERITELVRREIIAEGRDGQCLVTAAESARILDKVVNRELDAAYLPARRSALAEMTLQPGTIAFQALSEAYAAHQPRLSCGPQDLTESAKAAFVENLQEALRADAVPADRLQDREALRSFAREHAARFLEQRECARVAVEGLTFLSSSEKAAISSEIMRNDIPARLVPMLGQAYRNVRADMEVLANPSADVNQQNRSLVSMVSGLHNAVVKSGIRVTTENQNELHEWFCRFLLAPAGPSQIVALEHGFAGKHRLLQGVAEGATWYRVAGPGTKEWCREYKEADGSLSGKPVHSDETWKRAGECSALLLALNDVLGEKVGCRTRRQALDLDDSPNDAAIAALRSFGVPFPAPNRVGHGNQRVPLSDAQTQEMNRQLHIHLADSAHEGVDESGLAKGCSRDLQEDHERYQMQRQLFGQGRTVNQYYIGTTGPLPQDPEAVAGALKQFCTERDVGGGSAVNGEMLRKVSAMAHQATFDCVHMGCMDAQRPDLAMVNGELTGTVENNTYHLFRTEEGEIRLELDQTFKPFWYTPVNGDARADVGVGAARPGHESQQVSLNPKKSLWRTRVEVKFDPHSHDPSIHKVHIEYDFVEGRHDQSAYPYFIRNPDLAEASSR